MVVFFMWLLLSFIVGAFGSDRKIGFFGALLLSLFLSPLIGVIGVALSERKSAKPKNYESQLIKLAELKDKNLISEDDFNEEKKRILRS